jgi:hypothetical protein
MLAALGKCHAWNWQAFEAVATALGAIATFLAVYWAVFGVRIRARRARPILVPEIVPDSVDSNRIPTGRHDRYYFRFRVWNRGRTPAHHVQVFAADLRKDGVEVKTFFPLPLIWSHTEPGASDRLIAPSICAGTFRHCDIGDVPHPRDLVLAEPDPETRFILATAVHPNTGSSHLSSGDYLLTIALSADNAETTRHRIRIRFTGKWDPNEQQMLREGCVVTVEPS